MASMASTPRPAVREPDAAVTQHLVTHRRELHAIPELSFREDETSHYILERLDPLGVDKLTPGVGGTGVGGDIRGGRPRGSGLGGGGKGGPPPTPNGGGAVSSTPGGGVG